MCFILLEKTTTSTRLHRGMTLFNLSETKWCQNYKCLSVLYNKTILSGVLNDQYNIWTRARVNGANRNKSHYEPSINTLLDLWNKQRNKSLVWYTHLSVRVYCTGYIHNNLNDKELHHSCRGISATLWYNVRGNRNISKYFFPLQSRSPSSSLRQRDEAVCMETGLGNAIQNRFSNKKASETWVHRMILKILITSNI